MHYCYLMFLRTLEKCLYELDLAKFALAPGLAWQAASKKTKAKLGILTDIDMLIIAERDIRGQICHSIF